VAILSAIPFGLFLAVFLSLGIHIMTRIIKIDV